MVIFIGTRTLENLVVILIAIVTQIKI